MKQIIQQLIKFRDDRNWGIHHTPESLAYALACEAGELLRLWEWGKQPDIERVKEEVADVAIYAIYFRESLGIDCFVPKHQYAGDVHATVRRIYYMAGSLLASPISSSGDSDDIMSACRHLSDLCSFNLLEAITEKIAKNALKYKTGIDHAQANGWNA